MRCCLRIRSVVEADSPTVPVFVIVVPAVPAFTVAAMVSVAVELALISPIVHVPVEVAYVPAESCAYERESGRQGVVATTPVESRTKVGNRHGVVERIARVRTRLVDRFRDRNVGRTAWTSLQRSKPMTSYCQGSDR